MELGNFYFINDIFYQYFENSNLLINHPRVAETSHDRPCLCLFKEKNSSIYWMIPVSSQIDKYKQIYLSNINKYGNCDSIILGKLKGTIRAFLIQNMFPITDKYVKNTYLNCDNKPITISTKLQKEISKKAKKALALKKKGINIIFTDIVKIKEMLLNEV